jgi:hypothetical protein
VGAKLDLVLGPGKISHHSACEADQAEGRAGDFYLGDATIHVTTHPSEALMAKCAANLAAGLRPLVITTPAKIAFADSLADGARIASRVDIIDIEQFLSANLFESSFFETAALRPRLAELLDRYNQLIEAHEHDPALRIELG